VLCGVRDGGPVCARRGGRRKLHVGFKAFIVQECSGACRNGLPLAALREVGHGLRG